MKNPFTSPEATGVFFRYLATIILTTITLLGSLAILSPEQQETLTKAVTELMAQLPGLVATLTALATASLTAYATVTKSRSEKADEAAKEIDKNIPPSAPVEIVTEGSKPNIIVPGK